VSSNFTTALIFPAGQVPLSSVWPSSGIRYPEGTAEGNHYLSMATWTFFFGTKKNGRLHRQPHELFVTTLRSPRTEALERGLDQEAGMI